MGLSEVGDIDFGFSEPTADRFGGSGRSEYSDISPLLVGLYDSHKEYARTGESQPQFKEVICQQMADILSVSSRVVDREMVTDVLVTLLRQSETDLKAAMAERLALIENAPLRLLLQLLNDDISVAKPVILKSQVLNDLDLLYIIQSRDTTFWQVIAERKNLNENVVDALADTHDVPTAKKLVANDTIQFSKFAMGILEGLAKENEDLARPLLQRPDVPEHIARALYQLVGQELKIALEEKSVEILGAEKAAVVADIVHDVVGEFAQDSKAYGYMPTEAMMRAADLFLRQGKLDVHLMLRTLKRGQASSYVAQLSTYSGLSPDIVISLLQQKNGQGLAVIARACGIKRQEFAMLFVLTRQVFDKSEDVSAAMTIRAHEYFDKISVDLARTILKRSQH